MSNEIAKKAEDIRRTNFEMAKAKLAAAVPKAIDNIVEVVEEGTERNKIAAAKLILEQNAAYEKKETEQTQMEFEAFLNESIIQAYKEIMRKDIFIEVMNRLGPDTPPEEVVKFREKLDAVFGIEGYIEAEVVEDDIAESDSPQEQPIDE